MPALLGKRRDHEIGGAVHHLWAIDEIRHAVDEAAEPHDAGDFVEIAERGLQLHKQIDRARARRLLTVLDGNFAAELAFGNELAFGVETKLAGYDEKISGAYEADIVGDGRGSRMQHNPKFPQLLFHRSRHSILRHNLVCAAR